MSSIPLEIQSLIEQEMVLGHYSSSEDVLRRAMQVLQNEREILGDEDADETIAGIRRGLAESAAGKGISLAEAERNFRARKGIGDDV